MFGIIVLGLAYKNELEPLNIAHKIRIKAIIKNTENSKNTYAKKCTCYL